MATDNQINLKPHFLEIGEGPEKHKLPCEGKTGDLFVFTPLKEIDDPDRTPQGRASLWFCTKGAEGDGRHAIWARVQFNFVTTCAVSPPKTPQNHPEKEG